MFVHVAIYFHDKLVPNGSSFKSSALPKRHAMKLLSFSADIKYMDITNNKKKTVTVFCELPSTFSHTLTQIKRLFNKAYSRQKFNVIFPKGTLVQSRAHAEYIL